MDAYDEAANAVTQPFEQFITLRNLNTPEGRRMVANAKLMQKAVRAVNAGVLAEEDGKAVVLSIMDVGEFVLPPHKYHIFKTLKEFNMPTKEELAEMYHWDWPWPFNKLKRKVSMFNFGEPRLLYGEAEYHGRAPKPINPAGTWQVSWYPGAPWWAKWHLYVSYSCKRQADGKFRNFRIGPRWDNVDDYVNFVPFAPSSRRYSGKAIEDTST